LDFSDLSSTISCDLSQNDVLRSQEQASADHNTRTIEPIALNDQISSLYTPEDSLLIDYLNPEPGDLVWNLVCQGPHNQDYASTIGDPSSSGLNTKFDQDTSIKPADLPVPITFSTRIHSPTLPEIEYPQAQLLNSIASSGICQSIADISPEKGSRSSRLSSPQPRQPRLMPFAKHPCKWATCLEIFDQALKLRTHVRLHASRQARCMWTGCFKVMESTPDLKKHLDSHIKPHACSVCQHQAATARDLSRHTLSHSLTSGNSIYYCPSSACPYRQGGHKLPFGRRDNAARHINNKHPGLAEGPVFGIYQI